MMWYVYVLESMETDWTYVGFTDRLKERILEHNAGKNQSTKAYAPFNLGSFIAVDSRERLVIWKNILKRVLELPG